MREHLPQIVAGSDIISDMARTVRVPVRMLEHYRFQAAGRTRIPEGVGQGKPPSPGDVLLGQGNPAASRSWARAPGGKEGGGTELLLEFKVDEIIDWLWEDLKLPNLQPRAGPSEDSDWQREGLGSDAARVRGSDRRRSFKESVKRRAKDVLRSPAFTDEDLRFRQLKRRRQPAMRAAVFFLLDVSGSMTERDRQVSKTFFLLGGRGTAAPVPLSRHRLRCAYDRCLGVQRIRVLQDHRQRRHRGISRIRAKCARSCNRASIRANCNVYLFYASDGDNAVR